jgi:hypothetical protein
MLQSSNQIRLTPGERRTLEILTDIDPIAVRTLADLERFVDAQKALVPGRSAEGRILRSILDSMVPGRPVRP